MSVEAPDQIEAVVDKRWGTAIDSPTSRHAFDVRFVQGALGMRLVPAEVVSDCFNCFLMHRIGPRVCLRDTQTSIQYGFGKVTGVTPGGQAAKGGVAVDDVLASVDAEAVTYKVW